MKSILPVLFLFLFGAFISKAQVLTGYYGPGLFGLRSSLIFQAYYTINDRIKTVFDVRAFITY